MTNVISNFVEYVTAASCTVKATSIHQHF